MASLEEREHSHALIAKANEHGIIKLVDIRYPEYSCWKARKDSYSSWNYEHIVTAEALATSGFFYTGVGDKVRCFFCGMELHRWNEGDQPMEEHKKQFEGCGNVRLHSKSAQAAGYLNAGGDALTVDYMSAQGQKSEKSTDLTVEPLDMAELAETNRQLKIRVMCKKCQNKDRSVLFLPCSHLISCEFCVFTQKKCPDCQGQIQGLVKIHM